jgi:hypothetical protein
VLPLAAEDRLGFCNLGYFHQTLSAKPFADLGKRPEIHLA